MSLIQVGSLLDILQNLTKARRDITPLNVLSETEGEAAFQKLEQQESQHPSMPVISEDTVVYPTRSMAVELSGRPIVTDFGQMRPMLPMSTDWSMPDLYRAPEVLLKLPWTLPVDIWSVGVMVSLPLSVPGEATERRRIGQTLELLEGKNLFDPMDRVHNQYVLPLALAQYIAILGPPPLEVIQQSPLFSTYFDSKGKYLTFIESRPLILCCQEILYLSLPSLKPHSRTLSP